MSPYEPLCCLETNMNNGKRGTQHPGAYDTLADAHQGVSEVLAI